MSKDFTHLHLHTEFSVLDGIIKIKKLCQRVKELGMSAVAVSDHGVLHGVIELYKAAKENGIKPIIAVEAYITEDEDGIEKTSRTRDNYHMILIAKNNQGLKNLYWLISNANINNFYYKPRISWRNLTERAEGLIATSSCLGGWVAGQGISENNSWSPGPDDKPTLAIRRAKDVFGENFYLEIQDNGLAPQNAYNQWLLTKAKEFNSQLVLTCDAHYLTAEDYQTHKVIMAQQFKKTIQEYDVSGCEGEALVYSSKLYVRTPDDLYDVGYSHGWFNAAENTLEIARSCDVKIDLGSYQSPEFNYVSEPDYPEFLQWLS